MISDKPNMSRKDIFEELPIPSKVEEGQLAKFTYKGMFILVKLLLDIRLNLVKISEGKSINTKHRNPERRVERKPDNPIKGLENVVISKQKESK